MDTLLLKCCFMLALPFLVACAMTSAQPQAAVPLLHFQKTPCLGTCPSYEVTVYTDGRIQYQGYEHVALTDTATLTLSNPALEALVLEVKALQPMTLRDTYLTQWSDMPSTITRFYEKGAEAKRVKHQEGGPKPLLEFQEKLHLQLMQLVEAEAYRRLPTR